MNNEWEIESDRYDWVDPETGYDCMILRKPYMLHLCGYVRVPAGHTASEKHYDDLQDDVEIHGGLIFSSTSVDDEMYPLDDGGAWFGFDCAVDGDLVPHSKEIRDKKREWEQFYNVTIANDFTYRNVDFVKSECASLAKQLKAMETER